ncbi:YncE family protein [Sphingomonas nostoxanthinifaciens]|uniref:YncE family protein n=1 Tax=Sphingomonas nostoxanthinifaciens TaxID=2872652 RepID=UPI001CC1D355|nr:hypothetical protein [Sphingomonas nostoxanthinifaciens]UAK25795.1 hypothetical protein K8P63_06600 [Sphingomonas nostoxanthinifaciens]
MTSFSRRRLFDGLLAFSIIGSIAAPAATADPSPVLTLERSVPIPGLTSGDLDHLAVDLAHRRLYTSAQTAHTIEEFDLTSGAHLRSVKASVNPHYIFFAPAIGQIILADGGEKPGDPGQIRFIDPATMATVDSVKVRYRTDADLFDASTGRFYSVSAERGGADSLLTVIDVAHRTVVASAPIPSTNVEGMAIDSARGLLFMNLRDAHAVGMFDLKANRMVARWAIDGMNKNTPMAYDPATRRLFVIGRDPGRLYVIDVENGRLLSTTDCLNDGDDMTYDAIGRRLLVSTDQGFVVMARRDTDHFEVVQTGGGRGGKSSAYVPSLAKVFVGRAPVEGSPAAIDIYDVAKSN